MNWDQIFICLTFLSTVYCYPPKNNSCDCVCGKRFSDSDAQSDENPWIVGVFWGDFTHPTIFICSGTLISDKHVLVSAECGNGVLRAHHMMHDHSEVRMGGHNVDAIKRNIVRVYRHENYEHYEYAHFDKMSNEFDIAILELDRAVLFGPRVQPICLPQTPDSDYSGMSATVIGLYDTSIQWEGSKSKKQQTNIPIWTNEECVKRPEYSKQLTDNMICAGVYENGTHRTQIRFFDSGQLVIENGSGSMELIGIYSFGPRSGLTPETPPVYTRVANFLPWIKRKLRNQCLCSPENVTRNATLEKHEVPKEQTNISLQSVSNSTCNVVCGRTKQRISYNHEQFDENPWLVGVFWGAYHYPKIFICSGTLISDKHVLVSAQCANEVLRAREDMCDHTIVRMGGDNVDAIKRNIIRVYRHENYKHFKYVHFEYMSNEFDIAILQMDKAVSFGPDIQPICLPQSPDFDYSGKSATAIGLYDTGVMLTMSRSKAQRTDIPIWTKEECSYPAHYAKQIPDNMICAGDYENGPHRTYIRGFDFGQLVIKNDNGSMELVGIYSFGSRSKLSPGRALVFTRVASYLPWIQSKMNKQCTYTFDQDDYFDS